MNKIEEKATEIIAKWETEAKRDLPFPATMQRLIVQALEEHGRDMQLACAEAVMDTPAHFDAPTGTDLISPDDAHAAIMNVKMEGE